MSQQRWRDTWDDFTLWLGLHGFEAEVPFRGVSGKRRWRFDFALTDGRMVALEYDGLGHGKDDTQARGGHETRRGLLNDAAKGNEAQLLGWRLIRCHAATVESGDCHAWVEAALRGNPS